VEELLLTWGPTLGFKLCDNVYYSMYVGIPPAYIASKRPLRWTRGGALLNHIPLAAPASPLGSSATWTAVSEGASPHSLEASWALRTASKKAFPLGSRPFSPSPLASRPTAPHQRLPSSASFRSPFPPPILPISHFSSGPWYTHIGQGPPKGAPFDHCTLPCRPWRPSLEHPQSTLSPPQASGAAGTNAVSGAAGQCVCVCVN